MKLQIVQDYEAESFQPANELGAESEALTSVLSFSVDDAGFVVFERGATWPATLGGDLAGRLGVTVLVQQPEESHEQLLTRVRNRATRIAEPVGQLVWLGSEETQVPWQELLRALFASNEFGPECSFSVYSGASAAVLAFEGAPPPRWSMVRATSQADVAVSA